MLSVQEVRPLVDEALPRVQCVESGTNHGRFEVTPLEGGFGVTIGNAMRRVLLASLPGAAVTWIKIRDVAHEFSDIANVKEDVTQIVLAIKQIRLRSTSSDPVLMHLAVGKEGPVTAGDIEYPSSVEIVNPDLYLFTQDSGETTTDIEFTVEQGKGYIPAEERESAQIGMIPVDAIYTPVTKVSYAVDHTRVGAFTNFDRLSLDVWTDGTISPEDAVSQAATILVSRLNLLVHPGGLQEAIVQGPTDEIAIPARLAETPIEELDLSVRAFNCLKRSSITKLGQVLRMTDDELLAVRHFGRKSLDELYDRLQMRLPVAVHDSPFGELLGDITTDTDEEA